MKKISFNNLLRNDRLMLICSVLLAVIAWYFVISGSSNITTRTITCTLNTANVHNGSLQVIEEQTVTVEVEVEGAWSDIIHVTAEDIRLQLNANDIQTAGICRLHILANRNSQNNDYSILSTSPSTVSLYCDEWTQKEFHVANGDITAKAPSLTAAGEGVSILYDEIAIAENALPGGVIYVQGPRTQLDRITHLEARVTGEAALTERQVLSASLVALDAANQQVDLQHCTLSHYDANNTLVEITALDVLVTLEEKRDIPFTIEALNTPSNVVLTGENGIVTMEPASITVRGEQELLKQYTAQIAQLRSLDFDFLTVGQGSIQQTVELPAGITVVGNNELVTTDEQGRSYLTVTLNFNWSGYTSKRIVWNIGSNSSNSAIRFNNLPAGKDVSIVQPAYFEIVVCGKADAIKLVGAEDIYAEISLEPSGSNSYSIRPIINNPDVWMVHGDREYVVDLDLVDRVTAYTAE